MLKNPLFCSFAWFSIVLQTPFFNEPESSRNLTIFMITSISSFKIVNVIPDPEILPWISASVANAAAVNPNCIRTHFANGVNSFFNNSKLASLMEQKNWVIFLLNYYFFQ